MRNSCDFRFEFNNTDRIYEAGEEVSGLFTLTPRRTLRCNALKLELRWRTHGQGNRAQGNIIPLDCDFYETEIIEGQSYEVAFSFLAPPGPLTYHGKYLNIDWYLKATVDAPLTPGFLDPSGETEILLLPRKGQAIVLGPSYRPPKDPRGFASVNWFLVIFGAAFSLIGLIVFLAFISGGSSPGRGFFNFFSIVPLIFVGVGLAIVFASLRNFLASSTMTNIEASFDKRKLVPGEQLSCSLHFEPRTSLKIDEVFVTLKGEEVVVRGSGSNRKTYSHTFFEQTQQLLNAQQLSPGSPIDLASTFTLPLNAPYTFMASDNTLKWSVSFKIDRPGILDWEQSYQIDVVPWLEETVHGDVIG